ncbi:hypothetical protein MRX96_006508 [Rhipicephalus microplus]
MSSSSKTQGPVTKYCALFKGRSQDVYPARWRISKSPHTPHPEMSHIAAAKKIYRFALLSFPLKTTLGPKGKHCGEIKRDVWGQALGRAAKKEGTSISSTGAAGKEKGARDRRRVPKERSGRGK